MNEIIKTLSEMLKERVVVTREELERKAIRAIIKSKSVGALNIDYNLIQEIVDGYIECPISLNCLHFSEKIEIGDLSFYRLHTSKPTKDQFEEAYEECIISRRYIDALDRLDIIVDRFFKEYSVKEGVVKEYSKNKYKYAVFFSLIDDVDEDLQAHLDFAQDYDGEYVIVTLTEKTPCPFIKFFKNHSEKTKAANIKIWVADVDRDCIDPFIGYPKDFKLLKGFKNPKLASIINSLWRVKVDKIVEI
ncbi:hypothetical protein DRO97_03060 [Archaeoglobales archaeon]|nr:MAG: hypothetical protein DRO97_03060 [Archaeoglobales archaeon]